jgi:hypothetical protein
MLVRLIQIERGIRGGSSSLKEVYVNSQHIISVSEDNISTQQLVSEANSLGLAEGVVCSRLVIHEGNVPRTLVVVGSPNEVYQKIKRKQLLKG